MREKKSQRKAVNFIRITKKEQMQSKIRKAFSKKDKAKLEELEKNRMTMRASRDRSGIPKVAIVGYTNAGKSTLFKILTGELDYDEGTVTVGPGRRVGLISQIPVYPAGYTVEDVLRSAFAAGQYPDTISTDITKNSAYKRGGRYGLPMCMSMARAAGMAEALLKLADNGLKGAPLMQGTEDYHVDEGTDKIRIAYDKYLGE